ncbi:alanine--tRNA ligase [bacterium]|nr:alanine--tRNA ligase [bacterium]
MLSNEIRESFLEFYRQKGHTELPSASVVPVADPTLLLINAGMAPLKRYFMGQEKPPAPTATNAQKCIRTIDIEQVGKTNRHNTFFEMLGKFSFGAYFKAEAMRYTIEWMSSRDWLNLDTSRLYITHHEKDEETRNLWLKELGWPEERLFGLGDADNRWAAGDTGPWGYDTEYFWDFAPDGQPVDRARFIELSNSGRIVEIGNDVFMQFQRAEDGSDSELPSRNVDYGGGLERFSMVKQDVRTVYKTDCMDYLIRGFAEVVNRATKHSPGDDELFELGSRGFNPYWLAADHIRTATVMLGDGINPGNNGRNYVLRKLIRRIISRAFILGVREPFIMGLSDLVIAKLGSHYGDLQRNRERLILPWITKEEEQFFAVMNRSFDDVMEQVRSARESGGSLSGSFAFEMYDTYGFPFEVTRDLCELEGVALDEASFNEEMEAQRERARSAGKFEGDMGRQEETALDVKFLGYEMTSAEVTVRSVEALADIRGIAPLIAPEDPKSGPAVPGIRMVTDSTPFYSNSGGQPDDSGWLPLDGQNYAMQSGNTRGVHIVRGEPGIEEGSRVIIAVNQMRREALRRPHTTNHLMLEALKQVLGGHVTQAGSQLSEDEIRFDFSHFQAAGREELQQIEELVNRWIIEDHPVVQDSMPLTRAKEMGVTAVFDEKYGNEVRVISIGEGDEDSVEGWVSRELCGGTHLDHTSQACRFVIVKEESVQSGIRRIYALTGFKALAFANAAREAADGLALHYKVPLPIPTGTSDLDDYAVRTGEWRNDLLGRISETEQSAREARQQAVEARRELEVGGMVEGLAAQAQELKGLRVLVRAVELGQREDVKYLVEKLGGQVWKDSYLVFLAANVDGKAVLVGKLSKEALDSGLKASELIREAAKICQGGGGGRPDFAEAGGKDGSMNSAAAEKVMELVNAVLGS